LTPSPYRALLLHSTGPNPFAGKCWLKSPQACPPPQHPAVTLPDIPTEWLPSDGYTIHFYPQIGPQSWNQAGSLHRKGL